MVALRDSMPKPGQTIAGKYAIQGVLGQGGMAVVYEATHLRLRQRVAIKMLLPNIAELPEVSHRFEREARAVVQLHGPNVAHVIDVDSTPEGLPYIVMEFLEGKDLAVEIVERKGTFPIDEAVGYILQACSAMAEAHALGIIHRDLKPANLFLCDGDGPRVLKVLDFGVSKLSDQTDTYVTETAVVLGTPVYMSPEQIDSAKKVDGRTDIWALGVILYELIACELPFRGTNAAGVIASVMADAPKPLRSRRPDAPTELVDVVMKALSKDPDKRYKDIAEFAQAVAPFGPPPGEWSPPEPPSTRSNAVQKPSTRPSTAPNASSSPDASTAAETAPKPRPEDVDTQPGEQDAPRASVSGVIHKLEKEPLETTPAAWRIAYVVVAVILIALGIVYAISSR